MKIRTHVLPGMLLMACAIPAIASSHREAPFITEQPKVDGTDLYMFRSYETDRSAFVTLIANYLPLQDAYGGPNYFALDPDALYEIHVDNNGNAVEDLTFQFRFTNTYTPTRLPIGPGGALVTIPLINAGSIGPGVNDNANLGVRETYSLTVVRGNRRSGNATRVSKVGGGNTFEKPVDNIGPKSIPNYAAYADAHIFPIDLSTAIPGCATPGKVFVGQRKEGFVVLLGQIFDLINVPTAAPVAPTLPRNAATSTIADKNITSLALEIPASCLTAGGDPVIGAWTTASLRQARLLNPSPVGPVATANGNGPAREGGAWTQVSRLGSPLVNEVVIGISDKDKFNGSEPKDDVANFGTYVLYPTLPALVDVLFSVPAPATPRNDLLAAFVTGITTGPNDTPANFKFTAPANLTTAGEMLRLNTAVGITAVASQNDLGFLACDLGGFPNGRRPIDDVVDIELTVAEGALTGTNGLQTCDLSGPTPTVANPGSVVTDAVQANPADYLTRFPYLNTPLPGAVNL